MVGTGSIAKEHIDAFREIGGVEFDTVVSRLQENAEKFAERNGFLHADTDVDRALERGRFDTVIICSPSNLHASQTEKALQANKDVLVELPIATKYSDAEKIARLADQKGKILMVAHIQRFFQPLMEVKKRIQEGDFHPYHFTGLWFFLRRQNVNWKGRPRSWTDNLLWHHTCHVVDVALWLLGAENVDVSGMLSNPSETLNIPLDLSITIRTEQGKIAAISTSYNSKWPVHEYTLIGEEDTLIYRNEKLEGQEGVLCETTVNPIVLQDMEFLNAVRENRSARVNAWAVLPAMRALQRVQNRNPHILPPEKIA